MMSSGVALMVIGLLLIVVGIVIGSLCTFDIFTGYSCSPIGLLPLAGSTFLWIGGGVLATIIGTVFTAVGYSKRQMVESRPKVETGSSDKPPFIVKRMSQGDKLLLVGTALALGFLFFFLMYIMPIWQKVGF